MADDVTTERIEITCAEAFHDVGVRPPDAYGGREHIVETFVHSPLSGRWVPRGPSQYDRRGTYGHRSADVRIGMVGDRPATAEDEAAGAPIREKIALRCPCGRSPEFRYETLEPLLNALAAAGVLRYSLADLERRLT